MNCEIIIKDRAIVEYETPEFKDEKMEMTFKEFKAEFLRDKLNISKIEIVSYQKFDKELLSIASLIEDFKFMSRIENDLIIERSKESFYIRYKGNQIAMSYDDSTDMFFDHGTEYNQNATQSSKEAFAKISKLFPLLKLKSHNFIPNISFERGWIIVSEIEDGDLWEQYISNKVVFNVFNEEKIAEILIKDNTEIEKLPKSKKFKSLGDLIIKNESSHFIESHSALGKTCFYANGETYELTNGEKNPNFNMPENDAKKFIEIIEKAKHFIDDDFEDLLEPLKRNTEDVKLKEKMALLEEIDM
jgi:hypothetical protein